MNETAGRPMFDYNRANVRGTEVKQRSRYIFDRNCHLNVNRLVGNNILVSLDRNVS